MVTLSVSLTQAARAFEEGLSELLGWIEAQRETLDNMAPPDEDANVLQEQIEENKVRLYLLVSLCTTVEDIMPFKYSYIPSKQHVY